MLIWMITLASGMSSELSPTWERQREREPKEDGMTMGLCLKYFARGHQLTYRHTLRTLANL